MQLIDSKGEVRDGMRIDWDAPIEMDDGVVLRADVFCPDDDGRYPVIMTHGPYAKGLPFQKGFAFMWERLERDHPDALAGSSNRYQNWETVDPEKWVPDGYAVVRVDSRGAGRSPGFLDVWSPRETRDFAACIEWAGTQTWSSGKVGLLGVSYYAINQWQVSALQPQHLEAICPWEGASDHYRELARHGGILLSFIRHWYPAQVKAVQHGVGERGAANPNTGEPAAGPETLSDEELEANRADAVEALYEHPLDDDYHRGRSADLSQIEVPLLSATNWAHALHTRGNFEAYRRSPSRKKWLEVHGLEHWSLFYSDYGVDLQKRFFGHFLKGEDTGWDRQPPVFLNLRKVDGTFAQRGEQEWPLARTEWTRFHLDPDGLRLSREQLPQAGSVAFEALGEGLTFLTEPLERETEITGPASARLFVASTTSDADVFLVLRVLDPDGEDVKFVSGIDPQGVVTNGWLRASHRKLDRKRSLPYHPWHTHDERWPLTPGETVELDVEIWPTSVIVPAGYRIGLSVLGRDFEWPGEGPWPEFYPGVPMKGNGVFVHNDPRDRPSEVYGGITTLVSGGEQQAYVLLPVIPGTGKE